MGQLVCAVIANSEVQAKRAAKEVKIIYEDLQPLILTIEVINSRQVPAELIRDVLGEMCLATIGRNMEFLGSFKVQDLIGPKLYPCL